MSTDESGNLPSSRKVEVRIEWNVRIPMRDGVHLSATLYLPRRISAPTPIIFTLTPYVAQTSHEFALYFAEHGYPFLTIDVRGRGNSEGRFKANGNEAKDGYDTAEWLARQPYCSGEVAMWGGSYSGYVQWAAAKEFPGHLATIVPVASPFRGVDSPSPNNIFVPYRMQWLTLLAGHTSQDKIFADQSFWNGQFQQWSKAGLPFKQLDSFIGHPSPIFQEWLAHPHRDAYWDSYNPSPAQYAKISIPVLTITGIYDTNQSGALMHYREHLRSNPTARARHYLVIGPWDHAGTRTPKPEFGGIKTGRASLLDLPRLHLEWYAWTMQGGPKPQFLHKAVAYYVMGAEKWRYADALEAVTAGWQPLYLRSSANPTDVFRSGSLTIEPLSDDEPDHYVYDPRDVSLAELESTVDPANLTDQRLLHASAGKQLVYHSAPFADDLEVSGFFKLEAWLSIDQPDTDFCVTIHEVCLDGSAIQLTCERKRARYRESLREEHLITTSDPLRYLFECFTFVARCVRKGHRLRLVIGPINSIFWQKNHNTGGAVAEESMADARPVTVRLFHDRSHPSTLHVPIGQTDASTS